MSSYQRGLALRKKVLGRKRVDQKLKDTNTFDSPIQALVTEFAWGTIWSRPGLTLKQRSLLNLGMLIALNRPHELKGHIGGALNNGLSEIEIREALIQAAVYCGFPAALDSFRIAREAIKDFKSSSNTARPARRGSTPRRSSKLPPKNR